MGGNSFGTLFRITTFGESHGKAVGVIVDGAAPGLELSEKDIQKELDRRKPGQADVGTPRMEPDTVHLVSGLFEGRTTGTPLCMLLYNSDADPSAYESIKGMFRPGHADYTYTKKYGLRDWRGSGRASGRETAGRVAAGAVAKKLLKGRGVSIAAYTKQIGPITGSTVELSEIERNPVRAADPQAAVEMEKLVLSVKEQNDSIGGIVECLISGIPAGLGEPVFDKLDAELAHAVMSIGAVKGIEFGTGFQSVSMRGSEHNDEMDRRGFLTNHAGGILGGISNGEEIVFRIIVKPTSSIAAEQRTVDLSGKERTISTTGRHDACICPRIIPVVESMTAVVIEDHYKRFEAQSI